MNKEDLDLEEWTEKRFEELKPRLDEIEEIQIMLQQQLTTLEREKLSIRGGLVELKKIRKEFLGIEDDKDEDNEDEKNEDKEDES